MALEDIDSLNEKEVGQSGHTNDHKKIVRSLKSVKEELRGRLSEEELAENYAQIEYSPAYASVFTIPTLGAGIDAAPLINSYLSDPRGGTVKRVTGEAIIRTPIVIPSDTTVEWGTTKIVKAAGTQHNMLVNRAVIDNRRFNDAITTVGSTILTSPATAKFVAGDVGRRIAVQGAGLAGSTLVTTITSVQSATQATLAVPATLAVNGQYAYIGNRDKNIVSRGGYWYRSADTGTRDPANGLYGWSSNSLRFRHCDGIELRDVKVETYSGKYAISFGDVTAFEIRGVRAFRTNSDVVHINGPARDGRIRDIQSEGSGDDLVSLTGGDFVVVDTMGDTNGDITDILIEGLSSLPSVAHEGGPSGTTRGCLILAGQSQSQAHQFKAHRITLRNVATKLSHTPVFLGCDIQDVGTRNGTYADIFVDNVVNEPSGTAPSQTVLITEGTFSNIELRSIRGTGSNNDLVVGSNTVINGLRLVGFRRARVANSGTISDLQWIGGELPYGTARGAISAPRMESLDRRIATTPVSLPSGTIVFTYWRPESGVAVGNFRNVVVTGSDDATFTKVGLYSIDASGNLTKIAETPSSTTSWNTASAGQSKSRTTNSTVTVSPINTYAVAHLFVGTTPPLLAGIKIANGTEAGTTDILGKILPGQSDLPAIVSSGSLVDGVGSLIYSRIW